MGIPEVLDNVLHSHGNRQGMSIGWLAAGWMSYILSEADHRMSEVEPWAAERMEALRALPSLGIAGSVRDRLQQRAGEGMGSYVGVVRPNAKYDLLRAGFWENARRFHRKMVPLYTNKNLFQDLLMWCYLDPSILEALNFKRLGNLVSPDSPRYEKLSAYGNRDDVILALLKTPKSPPDRPECPVSIPGIPHFGKHIIRGEMQ